MPKKPLWEDDITCPWCQKINHIKVEKETITPAEPAETEIHVQVSKAEQTTLDEGS